MKTFLAIVSYIIYIVVNKILFKKEFFKTCKFPFVCALKDSANAENSTSYNYFGSGIGKS